MGVDDAAERGAAGADLLVDGQFRRWRARSFHGAAGADANDTFAAETAFIDAGRGDPDVAVFFADGEVAAGSGGHAIAVDPLHGLEDFIARMHVRMRHGEIMAA